MDLNLITQVAKLARALLISDPLVEFRKSPGFYPEVRFIFKKSLNTGWYRLEENL